MGLAFYFAIYFLLQPHKVSFEDFLKFSESSYSSAFSFISLSQHSRVNTDAQNYSLRLYFFAYVFKTNHKCHLFIKMPVASWFQTNKEEIEMMRGILKPLYYMYKDQIL
jgi:hypothetical protein